MIYESIQDLKLPYFEVQYLDDDEVNFIKERFTILSKKKVG